MACELSQQGAVGLAEPGAMEPFMAAGGDKMPLQRPFAAGVARMAYNDLRMDNQWLPFTPNRS
ncbi:MAG: hypothetical protein KIT86_22340, partial [Hydrogenophaga sp.]|uniref:hypothetical protein n=1 Tax=Hydrogenophaga sp. TaxID=1904254 RepID=UPI002629DA63